MDEFVEDALSQSLKARPYYSGFEEAHDTYNALSKASDGKIYYVLSSESIDHGGQVHVYDPQKDEIKFLGDLTDICGEKNLKAIPQGKSHVEFYEMNGKLYFGTHIGYYEMIDGIERLPQHPPKGYSLYPGGHIISYDLATRKFEDLATVPGGEGILTMTVDHDRGHIYGITWPYGNFINYNSNTKELKNHGFISAKGEAGTPGSDYRVLCRSLFVDPNNGRVYGSTAEGNIFFYDPVHEAIQSLANVSLRLDYFGSYDFTYPGSMGYNWRKILWYAPEGVAYGVHGNSGYLFRFDTTTQVITIVDRITSEPSKRSGMFDLFTYGYLGFQLGPDGHTLYYLTGAPIFENGKRVVGEDKILVGAKGLENLHLVTYDLPARKYTDHGPIFYEDGSRPTYVNSIAVGDDGYVYSLARFEYKEKIIQDLVKISHALTLK
ncbi:MAG: hypothetical protein ABIN89_20825 [Chitinophagaceae bacterium]